MQVLISLAILQWSVSILFNTYSTIVCLPLLEDLFFSAVYCIPELFRINFDVSRLIFYVFLFWFLNICFNFLFTYNFFFLDINIFFCYPYVCFLFYICHVIFVFYLFSYFIRFYFSYLVIHFIECSGYIDVCIDSILWKFSLLFFN